jgi:YhcH/YjgK/YiaL family protein
MIYDSFENLNKYKGCFTGLDTLIAWAKTNRVQDLPLGKTIIDGENVFVNVMMAQTRPEQDAKYEIHHNYMDLQMDLEGCERVQTARTFLTDEAGFNEQGDIGFGSGETGSVAYLGNGMFALFLAEEPHMPTLSIQGETMVKKAVFKIRKDG